MTKTLAFLTYGGEPEIAADDRLVADALARRGWSVRAHPWDAPTFETNGLSGAIIRSTWNYHHHTDRFGRWLQDLGASVLPVWNPPELVAWNSDKGRYLPQLESQGVVIPETEFLRAGSEASLTRVMNDRGWHEGVVFKPTASASAYGTLRVPTLENAAEYEATFAELLKRGGVMVQPFLPEIRDGEWSLIFFAEGRTGGEAQFSHAVLKRPASGDFRVQSELGGSALSLKPSDALLSAARSVLQRIPYPWLYVRLDAVIRRGGLCLMELELIEPGLFLATAPESAERFADAIEAVF